LREDYVEGSFKGRQAARYSLDFTGPEGGPGTLRSAWLQDGQAVCSLLVKGSEVASVEGLYLQALDRIVPAGRKGA
jgi:hypothetical protein